MTKWDKKYADLVGYHEKYGHTNVLPCINRPLAEWVKKQRNRKLANEGVHNNHAPLSQEQIDRLDAIDFVWRLERFEKLWEDKFERLKRYKEIHGDCLVSYEYPEDQALSHWVHKQREYNHRKQLRKDRKARLDSLGFTWVTERGLAKKLASAKAPDWATSMRDITWEQNGMPGRFDEKDNDGKVETMQPDSVGPPVESKDVAAKPKSEPNTRSRDVGALAESNVPIESRTEERKRKKPSFKCPYPRRKQPKKEVRNIAPDSSRVSKPADVGPQTEREPSSKPTNPNETKVVELAVRDVEPGDSHVRKPAFVEPRTKREPSSEHPNLMDARVEKVARNVESAVASRTEERKQTAAPPPHRPSGQYEKPQSKRAPGRPFNSTKWMEMYQKLVTFKDTNGDCIPPWKGDKELFYWSHNQRKKFRTGALPHDRKKLLDDIGFPWTLPDQRFLENRGLEKNGFSSEILRQARNTEIEERRNRGPVEGRRISGQFQKDYEKWMAMYQRLVTFKHANGNCIVGTDNSSLFFWAYNQRRHFRNGMLPPDRERLLDDIEFPWNLPDQRLRENRGLESDGLSRKIKKRPANSARYRVGTSVRKFFEGHGWFTGEIKSYDGEYYKVVYEDGDQEEYNDKDIENLVWRTSTDKPSTRGHQKYPDKKSTRGHQKYPIGTQVRKFFVSHGWFNGTVTNFDGSHYAVTYCDGDKEVCSANDLAKIVVSSDLAQVKVGSRVAVHWPENGRFYVGTVVNERDHDKSWCVEYDVDGSTEWLNLRKRKFRLQSAEERHGDPGVEIVPGLSELEIGSRISVQWPGDGRFYDATVTQERNRRFLSVRYDEGTWEWIDVCKRKYRMLPQETCGQGDEELGSRVSSDLPNVEVGSRVSIYWPSDDSWNDATVARERDCEQRLYLEFDDGYGHWIDLREHKFRILPEKMRFRSGIELDSDDDEAMIESDDEAWTESDDR